MRKKNPLKQKLINIGKGLAMAGILSLPTGILSYQVAKTFFPLNSQNPPPITAPEYTGKDPCQIHQGMPFPEPRAIMIPPETKSSTQPTQTPKIQRTPPKASKLEQTKNPNLLETTEGRLNFYDQIVRETMPRIAHGLNPNIYKAKPRFAGDFEIYALARTGLGEARSCPEDEEVIAVMNVITTRANRRKTTTQQEAYRPKQFSCFNKGDPNRPVTQDPMNHDPKSWERMLHLAGDVKYNRVPNPVPGADHYHARSMNKFPRWARHMKKVPLKGAEHIFYNSRRRR